MRLAPTPRREYLATLVLLAAGGVLGLVAASRPWGAAHLPSSLSVTSTTVSGNDLMPFAPAVSLVAIAAVVAVPAVRRIGRRVIGGVLALLGATLSVTAVMTVLDLASRIESWVTTSPATSAGSPAQEGAQLADEVSTSVAWGLAVAVAGAMVLVAGLLIAVRGPAWPAMGARYERVPRDAGQEDAQGDGQGDGRAALGPDGHDDGDVAGARETWDALDRGDDPT